jgi:dGTPase
MYRDMMNFVFYKNLEFLNNKDVESDIYKVYLNSMSDEYKNNTCNARIVIDYIAGMTDDYFIEEHKKLVKSK